MHTSIEDLTKAYRLMLYNTVVVECFVNNACCASSMRCFRNVTAVTSHHMRVLAIYCVAS